MSDFGGGLAAVLGGEAAERADDVGKLALAAVAGEDADEVGRDRVEAELRRESGKRIASLLT